MLGEVNRAMRYIKLIQIHVWLKLYWNRKIIAGLISKLILMCGSLSLTLYGNEAKQKGIWTSLVVFHCIFQFLGVR